MDEDDGLTLLRLAEAVADGMPIDWGLETQAHQGLGARLRPFRLLEAVATAHRQPPMDKAASRAGVQSVLDSTSTAGPAAVSGVAPRPLSTWGPLQILELVGRGGFGEVYRAYDPSLRREVALKLWREDRVGPGAEARRFLHEARQLARVRHPNVLVVHGADVHAGRAGMWTDFLSGKTLEDLLSQQGPFGAHEAALIGIDLCRALAAAHAAGLVHGDLKTSNVMRERGGRIVLMDFGSVVEHPRAAPFSGVELSGGTPLFMAPERLLGEAAGPSSDIFSLGVILYRIVSGRFPIEAVSLSGLRERHERGELVPLRHLRPDLPTAFVQVVERALAHDPRHRFAGAGEMELALAASVGASTSGEQPRATRRRARIRRLVWISLAASVVLCVVAGLLWLHRAPAPRLTAEAVLYRVGDGANERLQPGARVSPGDHLLMEIEGAQKMNVYVLNGDAQGTAFVLFPLPGLDLQNPLDARVRHRLPGRKSGKQMTWEVTSTGGKEFFLVIAARQPLAELEQELARFPRAAGGREIARAPLEAQSPEASRGVGGLAEAQAVEAGANRRLYEIARRISEQADGTPGIWLWRTELDNPGP